MRTCYDYSEINDNALTQKNGYPSGSNGNNNNNNNNSNNNNNNNNNNNSNSSINNSSHPKNQKNIDYLTTRIHHSRGRRLSNDGDYRPEESTLHVDVHKPMRSRSAEVARTRSIGRESGSSGRVRSCSPSSMRVRHLSAPMDDLQALYNEYQQYSHYHHEAPAEQRDDCNTSHDRTIPIWPRPRCRLGKDMSLLADGINLDGNTRMLLAAFDARTLDDFYLMADVDFAQLVKVARATNHCLPPLQVRKVRMLRQWLKDLVDENMMNHDHEEYDEYDEDEEDDHREDHSEDDHERDDGLSPSHIKSRIKKKKKAKKRRSRRRRRLVPRDWFVQYRNDLPHLKQQLRQQGDSFFERFSVFGSVLSSAVTGCSTPTGYY